MTDDYEKWLAEYAKASGEIDSARKTLNQMNYAIYRASDSDSSKYDDALAAELDSRQFSAMSQAMALRLDFLSIRLQSNASIPEDSDLGWIREQIAEVGASAVATSAAAERVIAGVR